MATNQHLQIAQILADLQTLAAADPTAASTFLTAQNRLPSHKRKLSLPAAPQTDFLGRRIVPQAAHRPATLPKPDIKNGNGAKKSNGNGSRHKNGSSDEHFHDSSEIKDEDIIRAKELLELYGMKDSFRKYGEMGLGKAEKEVREVMDCYRVVERFGEDQTGGKFLVSKKGEGYDYNEGGGCNVWE